MNKLSKAVRFLGLCAFMTVAATGLQAQPATKKPAGSKPAGSQQGAKKPVPKKTAPAKKNGGGGKTVPAKPKTKPQRDTTNHWGSANCVRRKPEPTLLTTNPNVAGRTWELDSTFATEKIRMINGDSLIILHTGCDEYALVYTLKSPAADKPATDKAYWFHRASLLLYALNNSDVPFDYQEASALLEEHINKKDMQYAKDYYLYNEDDHTETLNIQEVGPMKKGGYLKMKLSLKVKL